MLTSILSALAGLAQLPTLFNNIIAELQNISAAITKSNIAATNAAVAKAEQDLAAAKTPADYQAAAKDVNNAIDSL